MPFPDVAGLIARLPEEMPQSDGIGLYGDTIAEASGVGGIKACLEGRPRWPAYGLACERIVQVCASLGHAVEIGH